MKQTLIILLITLLIFSCKSEPKSNALEESPNLPYALKESESGISFEVFDDSITDSNKYNYNNKILLPGRSFTYMFKHQTKEGQLKYFEKYKENDESVWKFVDGDNPRAIKKITIQVMSGNPMEEWVPGYNQTCLSYTLQHDEAFNMSGGVENEANLWLHPPRDQYFKILELNPFPYIKAPYEVGTEWTWQLTIGSQWSDPRWKVWEGNITNDYTYKTIAKENIDTEIGSLDCLLIEGTATSDLGKTSLISYYNEDYGFVKLEYTNIDGSKTFLDILQIEDGD